MKIPGALSRGGEIPGALSGGGEIPGALSGGGRRPPLEFGGRQQLAPGISGAAAARPWNLGGGSCQVLHTGQKPINSENVIY